MSYNESYQTTDSEFIIMKNLELESTSKGTRDLDFINKWVNDVTVENEIWRGKKLREVKQLRDTTKNDYDVIDNIHFLEPFCNKIQRRERKGQEKSKIKASRTTPKSTTPFPRPTASSANSPLNKMLRTSNHRMKTKNKKKCTMRIAELAVPTKRQCIDTWRNKSYVLPDLMVDRLKQHVLDQRPIVKLPEAIFCFTRRKPKSSKKSPKDKKEIVYEVFKPFHKMDTRALSIMFGCKIATILSKPSNLTLNSDLEKLSRIVASDIEQMIGKCQCENQRNKSIHKDVSNKITVWIAGILEDLSLKLLEEDLRELEEEEGHVLDFIDDVVDTVMNICEPLPVYVAEDSDTSDSDASKGGIMGEESEKPLTPTESTEKSMSKLDQIFNIIEDTTADTIQSLTKDTDDSKGASEILTDAEHFREELFNLIHNINKETELDISISKGPRDDISKEPGEDISKEPGADFSKEPGEDVNKEPGEDVNKEPGEDISNEPGEDFSKEPGEDINKEPGEDNSKEPGEDIGKEPGEDMSKEPGGDISKEPGEDIGKEPEEDISKEPGGDMSKDPGEDISKQPGEDISKESGQDISKEPGENIENEINPEMPAEAEVKNDENENTDQIDDNSKNIKENYKTEETNDDAVNNDSNVSEVFAILSEDSGDDKDSKKVKFSETDLVSPDKVAEHIKTSTTEEPDDEEQEQAQWNANNENSKPNIVFSEPNENLLSSADESWPADLTDRPLKVSDSANKSITSLGRIIENDEKQITPSDGEDNETDKQITGNVTKLQEQDIIDELYKVLPIKKLDIDSQTNKASIEASKETTAVETSGSTKVDSKPFEDTKTFEETKTFDETKTDRSTVTKTLDDKPVDKSSKHQIYARESALIRIPSHKTQSEIDYGWKVHPNTAPSWVTSWGHGRGEPSEDSIPIQIRPTKVREIDVRKWCQDLQNAFINLEMWNNWIDLTCKETFFLLNQKEITRPGLNRKNATNWIGLKENIDKDAILWKNLHQRTNVNFKTLKRNYNNIEIVTAEYCTKCTCCKTSKL